MKFEILSIIFFFFYNFHSFHLNEIFRKDNILIEKLENEKSLFASFRLFFIDERNETFFIEYNEISEEYFQKHKLFICSSLGFKSTFVKSLFLFDNKTKLSKFKSVELKLSSNLKRCCKL